MAGYAIVPDIDAADLTGIDLAVWTALCRYADWELKDGKPVRSVPGTCYPSLKSLQKTARCSKATLCRAMQKLERLGFVVRQQGGSNYSSTAYTLFPNGQEGCLAERQGVSQTETGDVSQRDRGCLTVRHYQTHIPYPYTKPIDQTSPPTPQRGDAKKAPYRRRRDRARNGVLPTPPPPATWEEAVRQYRERNGFDLTGGENYAETGLAQIS